MPYMMHKYSICLYRKKTNSYLEIEIDAHNAEACFVYSLEFYGKDWQITSVGKIGD